MAFRVRLSEFGTSFATRGRGNELRAKVLDDAGASAVVIVDLDGVDHMSYSFADEFLGKLVADAPVQVDVENAAAPVARTVDDAVRRRTGLAAIC